MTVLDALGIESATTMGLSAGAMFALAAVALERSRFAAAAVIAGPAPYGAVGLDWFAGMAQTNREEFEAALRGRDTLTTHLATDTEFDLGMLAPEDLDAMHGPYWDWQLCAAGAAVTEGMIEDELACVADWGFRLHDITNPVLVIHGAGDTFVPASTAGGLYSSAPRKHRAPGTWRPHQHHPGRRTRPPLAADAHAREAPIRRPLTVNPGRTVAACSGRVRHHPCGDEPRHLVVGRWSANSSSSR